MKLKKVTTKDRYGNQVSYEYEAPSKQLDPTKLAEKMMDMYGEVPEMEMGVPDHPGEPQGTDTVPAWLTPGEFVMNAEATRMFGPQIEQMNNAGREIQRAQGGTVPQYHADGGTVRHPFVSDDLLDALAQVESGGRHTDKDGNLITSPAGAVGKYQWIPRIAEQGAGYGVEPFDPTDEAAQREASRQYLLGLQQNNPGWSKEDVLRAYNWGPGNVHRYMSGKRKDIPKEAQEYPSKILRQLSKMRGHETYFNNGGLIGATPPPLLDEESMLLQELEAQQAGGPPPLEVPDEESSVTFGGQNISAQESEVQADFNKQKQFDSILNAVQNGQLKPEQAREAVKGMGSNWVGKFDSQARAGGVGESAGLAGTVGELSDNLATDAREALGVEDLRQGFIDDYNYITTGEKTVPRIGAPDVATVETNPELNQEANAPEPEVESTPETVIKETDNDEQAVAENKELSKIPNKEIAATGEEIAQQEPGALDRVTDAFTKAFGSLIDDEELAATAILYLGSRAMGYSHAGSMRWASKRYLNQISAKKQSAQAAAAKHEERVVDLAKSDKIDPKSFEEFKRTRNVNSLKPANKSSVKRISAKPEVFYGPDNKPIKVWEYDGPNGKYFGNAQGGEIPTEVFGQLHQEDYKVPGTKAYNDRVKGNINIAKDQITSLRTQFGGRGKDSDDKTIYATDINPSTQAGEIAKWAAKNDVNQEELAGLIESAYHDALNDERQDGKKVRDLTPYLNQLVVRKLVGNPDIFRTPEGGLVAADKLANVNNVIKNQLPEGSNVTAIANQYYNSALEEWNALGEEGQKRYNDRANDGENGFYVFVANDLKVDNRMSKK